MSATAGDLLVAELRVRTMFSPGPSTVTYRPVGIKQKRAEIDQVLEMNMLGAPRSPSTSSDRIRRQRLRTVCTPCRNRRVCMVQAAFGTLC